MNRQQLNQTMRENDAIRMAYSQYLNLNPRFLTPDMVCDLADDCGLGTDEAFWVLFSAALGLDTSIPSHRLLERTYIRAGVRKLDPSVYRNDRYYRTIRFSAQKNGRWEMRQESYAPFEPFVCGHPVLTPALREIPQLGYFEEEFSFPAILENGVEWMTVTPNEIETMRAPIAHSHGRVLTLGLGLGYFAFCASEKPEVEHVTVIERDREVIELFREAILPQFTYPQKIEIVQADAFSYMEDPHAFSRYDTLFADLWHDPSDGLDMYIRLRRLEKQAGTDQMEYWIEPTLLSTLRGMVYQMLNDEKAHLRVQGLSPYEILSDKFLHDLAPDLRAAPSNG